MTTELNVKLASEDVWMIDGNHSVGYERHCTNEGNLDNKKGDGDEI